MHNAMIIDGRDNVVVAIEPIHNGDIVTYSCAGKTEQFSALEDITIYHKLACSDIGKGMPIVKYGEHIGIAKDFIRAGEHVHVHNVMDHRENLDN